MLQIPTYVTRLLVILLTVLKPICIEVSKIMTLGLVCLTGLTSLDRPEEPHSRPLFSFKFLHLPVTATLIFMPNPR